VLDQEVIGVPMVFMRQYAPARQAHFSSSLFFPTYVS
jgi:hypothetical protein